MIFVYIYIYKKFVAWPISHFKHYLLEAPKGSIPAAGATQDPGRPEDPTDSGCVAGKAECRGPALSPCFHRWGIASSDSPDPRICAVYVFLIFIVFVIMIIITFCISSYRSSSSGPFVCFATSSPPSGAIARFPQLSGQLFPIAAAGSCLCLAVKCSSAAFCDLQSLCLR